MTRLLSLVAFVLGASAVIWIGLGFRSSDSLALTVTVIIGAVFLLGFVEQLQFRRATASLAEALGRSQQSIKELGPWLAQLHPSLQSAVRLRIEGERVALPGPVLTPYLVGLLVMLGLLGTFIGMVVTLQGAVTALQGTTELQAIRAGLAAPIEGLSLAFGTSVAGVAASAMLGLISTLSRRERLLVARQLDQQIGNELRHFSANHSRDLAYQALQSQAQALPDLVDKLHGLAGQMAQMSEQLGGALTANQSQFHDTMSQQYQGLADSVGNALTASLSDSARITANSIIPVVEQAMSGLSEQAQQRHEQLSELTRQQLQTISERFQQTTEQVNQSWQQGLANYQSSSDALAGRLLDQVSHSLNESQQQLASSDQQRLASWTDTLEQMATGISSQWQQSGEQLNAQLQAAESLLAARQNSEQQWLAQQDQHLSQLTEQLRNQLSSLRDDEAARGDAAIARLAELEGTVSRHLGELGNALEAPMTRLIETASETPKAAAEVISQLREEMAGNISRDNALLDERQRLMSQLDSLLSAQADTAQAQRQAIDTLVSRAGSVLQTVSQQFSEQVAQQTASLSDLNSQIGGGAADVASLSEAFGVAVQMFSESNDKLVDNLQRIEDALEKSALRSDEQLGYYVDQAREIIDLSMTSQKDVIDALQRLGRQRHAEAEPS